MTNAEYITNKGWKFRDLFAQFSLKEEKWNIYKRGIDKKLDSIHTPDFKDYFHACDVVLAWLDMEHYEKPILDDGEKRYLKAVIRPWRDRVLWIARDENKDGSKSHICIKIKDEAEPISLPYFNTNTMYAGMEVSKPYSLEELEL